MTATRTANRWTADSASVVRPGNFRPDVEGLRAVAVVLIVLCHAGVPGLGGGYLGVDVFLVLSGFLVTALMLRELDETGELAVLRFWGRRARRILPAATLVVITVILAGHHWLGARRGDEIAGDARWVALLAGNLHDHLALPLQNFWPIAVGEQFVLVWPAALVLLIWLGFRWAVPACLSVAVLASFAYAIWPGGSAWSSFSPLARGWELGVGCLLAFVAGRLHRIPYRPAAAMAGVGLALIVVAALTFDATTPLPGYAAGLTVLGAVLVLAGRGDAVLSWTTLQWLGRLSYSFYLWHWPVLVLAEEAYGGPLSATTRAGLVLGSLVLAGVTYLGLEKPIRQCGRLRRSRLLALILAVLLIVAPLTVAHWKAPASGLFAPSWGGPVRHVGP